MPTKLLFICTHNRCRSILAEATARQLLTNGFEVASAGSQPAGKVHPLTLSALRLNGTDISNLESKSWDGLAEFKPDAVLTMCDSAANEACPQWFQDCIKVNWSLPDPSKTTGSDQAIIAEMDKTIKILEQRFLRLKGFDLNGLAPAKLQNALEQVIS